MLKMLIRWAFKKEFAAWLELQPAMIKAAQSVGERLEALETEHAALQERFDVVNTRLGLAEYKLGYVGVSCINGEPDVSHLPEPLKPIALKLYAETKEAAEEAAKKESN